MIRFGLLGVPLAKDILRTRGTTAPITIRCWFIQKVLGFNRAVYWPVHFCSTVTGPSNIHIGVGTAPGLSPGCYIQGIGRISIGDYTIVAPNVGIISANHDVYDLSKHHKREVKIGRYCWLGMNSLVLPGVVLGDHTVVSAGAVVKDCFPEGYCVLAGVPARVVKLLDREAVKEPTNEYEYVGYFTKVKFTEVQKRLLLWETMP